MPPESSSAHSEPPSGSRAQRLDRLGDAIEAYLERPDLGQTKSRAEYLEEHGALRELLEPMIEGELEAALPSRRQFGEYEILRELGRGGMGVVYEARQASLERHVALKVLSDPLALSPRKVERFRREAAAIARLRHPGIVPVYDVGSDADLHWYAMELVEGASLAELLEQARAATEPGSSDSRHRRALGIRPSSTYANEAAAVVAELAHALTHAHEHGLLHRDVKPGNVMISGERVLLLDFGLAKDLEKESLSRTGDFAGTPHYMSPEQASGSRELDARSDIFSLGVLLYEMLTLRRPFEADTTHALMARIAHADPVPPRRLQPGIPRELETICLKALERNPDARYTSAQDFAKDLQRFLTHEPIQARAPGAVTRTWKLARRKPAATTAAVLAFLLLAVAPVFFILYFKGARDELRDEQARTESARQEAVSLLEQLRTEKARTDQARQEAEESLSQLRSEQTLREEALERAELYLGKAREIVDRMLQRASRGQIRATPAMAELYEGMLDDTLNFYRDFVEAQPDDPALRRTAAESLQSIGKVQRLLGRSAASKASFDKALELYESVRGAGVGKPEIRNHIAGLLGDQAQVQIQLGQREEAMKLVQRSLAEYQKMEQDFPDAPWHERALLGTISAQTNLATLLMRDARKLDEALRLHEEAIAAFDRVPKEDRQVPPFANKEAQTRNNFGALLLRAGKPTEARRELDAAMEIRARVVATHSTPSFRREYGESLHNLSELLERSEPERAVGLLERAVAIFTRLKDELPTRPEFRSHFARSSGKLAQILARLNRPLEAEPHFVAYLETARALAREFPRQLQYRRELGFALTGYGIFLAADQNYAESKRHLREAMQLALALGKARSTDLETHQLLGYVLFASDRPFRRSQALQELCEFRQQALALRVKAKDPRIERILPGPSLAEWHELGIQDWISLGRYEEAFALFTQLLTIPAKDDRALAGRLALLSAIVQLARQDDGAAKAKLLERIDRYERRGVELLRALHAQAPELLDGVDWSFLHERPEIRALGLDPKRNKKPVEKRPGAEGSGEGK